MVTPLKLYIIMSFIWLQLYLYWKIAFLLKLLIPLKFGFSNMFSE
jgi:hypothetical protein